MNSGVLTIGNLIRRSGSEIAMVTQNTSDEDLFALVAKGNKEAFRMLIDRHLPKILSISTRMLGDPSQADDIAQDTMIRVWTAGSLWRPGAAKFSTWLHRVVVNLCIDRLRKRKFASIDEAETIAHPTANPLHDARNAELKRAIEKALDKLPGKQKAAIVLCHYQGFTGKEAAEILNISVLAVQSLLVRARITLKQELALYAEDMGDAA